MADEFDKYLVKSDGDEFAKYEVKPPGVPTPQAKMSAVNLYTGRRATPKTGETEHQQGFSSLTGAPKFVSESKQPLPSNPKIEQFKKDHPDIWNALKVYANVTNTVMPGELAFGTGGEGALSKALSYIKNRFGSKAAKVAEEAFKPNPRVASKMRYGGPAEQSGVVGKSIPRGRPEPLKAPTKFEANPKVAEKMRYGGPAEQRGSAGTSIPRGKPESVPTKEPFKFKPSSATANRMKYGGPLEAPTSASKAIPRGVQAKPVEATQVSPRGRLEPPSSTAPKAAAPSTSPRTIGHQIWKNEGITGQQFSKLPFKEQSRILSKYDPSHNPKTVTKQDLDRISSFIDSARRQ